MSNEEMDIAAKKVWSSKDVWKLVSGVAVAVFVITLIYARFLSLEVNNVNQKSVHAKDIKTIKEQHEAEMFNLREYFDTRIGVIEDRQTKQHARQDDDIKTLQQLSHPVGR